MCRDGCLVISETVSTSESLLCAEGCVGDDSRSSFQLACPPYRRDPVPAPEDTRGYERLDRGNVSTWDFEASSQGA